MKLDTRITELIAIGSSVTANCQPCLQYHVDKARESGASDLDIAQAIEVAKMVRKGAAAKMDSFAATMMTPVSVDAGAQKGGCGCS